MSTDDSSQSEELHAAAQALIDKFRDKPQGEIAREMGAELGRLAHADVPKSEKPEDVREKQFNALRPRLFLFGLIVAGLCVATSIALVFLMHFLPSHLSDSVAVAMISGLTVETLGIVAIIAHSLFPNR